jgi:energy-coupling factor transport system ATP-binding protein
VNALIEIENLHYRPEPSDPHQPDILRGIDLTIQEGAFIAIIGENGSGKTTLIKHINGLLQPTKGRVSVAGMDTRQPEYRARIQGMVGMVFQNPADQIVASTVEEDLAFGLENLNLPTPEIRARVVEQLSAVGLTAEADRPPHLLSGGQIQMVALAGVLARQPQVILFDEPTSMLDPQSRMTFLERLGQLHQQGLTIIYITHHMEEAVFADQVAVMHNGSIIHLGTPEEIFWNDINLCELGLELPETVQIAKNLQSLGWEFPSHILKIEDLLNALPTYRGTAKTPNTDENNRQRQVGKVLIHLDDVHYTYLKGSPLEKKALNGANLAVAPGKNSASAGSTGSGKLTLLQHINGLLRPEHGRVRVAEFILENPQTLLREVIRKVGLVFQNPETQFFEVFVGDEIAYGPKQFEVEDLRTRVKQAMNMVGLDFVAFKDRRLDTLSGGEKRKVALASTLVLDQDILMFDEPTAGMDPQARDDLLRLFRGLRESGKTLLIASHRMEELAAIADELSVMDLGKVIYTGPCGKVLSDGSAIRSAGLSPPLSIQIAQKLIEKGWPLTLADACTPHRLISVIEGLSG